jgi:heme/copper-type cytochrome/quinol oxidase subunit 2
VGGLTDEEAIATDEHGERLDSAAVSRSQRLTFLGIAAVIAIVAVIVLVATGGGDEETESAGSQATAPPTATASATPEAGETETPTPTATPKPQPPLVTSEGVTKLRFKQGDTVRFRVRSDVADEVHVHGYDLMKDVEPGQTITFSFPASITGIFEVELESAGKQIAQLRVDP